MRSLSVTAYTKLGDNVLGDRLLWNRDRPRIEIASRQMVVPCTKRLLQPVQTSA